ncbi:MULTISPECIES: hypothetical protein [unclassified Streptomyces]|uniref:hypothetical protein n=1 Tax=unclassified Streptomyces TaxID=2593676 RepID=UPI000939BEE4|nr:hypothetical protein [Streptomyces sp. CB01883]OKJ87267.1 hypothetical protein AMK32_08485 [Streptomyces sp. CB01883]
MPSTRNTIEDHENGIRYGGKILSLIPAPEGWAVGTQTVQYCRKTKKTELGTPRVFPLIAWALVDAMFRGGERKIHVEPLFLDESGTVTHATEFRWTLGAGDVDEDGWRLSVSVEVLPAPGAVANLPAYDGADTPGPGPS